MKKDFWIGKNVLVTGHTGFKGSWLCQLLIEMGEDLNAAINLTADENELIKRIINRGKSSGRSDEAIDIVKKRQKIYWNQTAPLIDYYQKKNILKNINGIGEIEEITERILQVIY